MTAFSDIYRVSYKKMRAQVTRGEEYKHGGSVPMKTTLKQYPVGERKFSARFFVEGEGGVFHVFYIHRTSFVSIEKDAHAEVCRVHPDNSLEFRSIRWMHQQYMAGAMLNATVHSSARHGGPVMAEGRDVLHPVFSGLRVDIVTHKEVEPYDVHYRKPIRTRHNEIRAAMQPFVNTVPVLLEAMPVEAIIDIYAEHDDAHAIPMDIGGWARASGQLMPNVLTALEAGHFVDALLLFAIHSDVLPGMWRQPHQPATAPRYLSKQRTVNVLSRLVPKMVTAVTAATHDAFKLEKRKEGEALAASKWGYEIRKGQGDLFSTSLVTRK